MKFMLDLCSAGLGGPLEGHSLSHPAGVAKRQRLPPARPSASHALVPCLLWEHFQDPHRDREYLDSFVG